MLLALGMRGPSELPPLPAPLWVAMWLWLPDSLGPEAEAAGCAPESTLPRGEGRKPHFSTSKLPTIVPLWLPVLPALVVDVSLAHTVLKSQITFDKPVFLSGNSVGMGGAGHSAPLVPAHSVPAAPPPPPVSKQCLAQCRPHQAVFLHTCRMCHPPPQVRTPVLLHLQHP